MNRGPRIHILKYTSSKIQRMPISPEIIIPHLLQQGYNPSCQLQCDKFNIDMSDSVKTELEEKSSQKN
jgi:hypothetical protein